MFEVEITVISEDGEPFGWALEQEDRGAYPRILVDPTANVAVGDKVLIEIVDVIDGTAMAQLRQAKKMDTEHTFLGQLRGTPPCLVRPFHRELQGVDFMLHDAPAETPENAVVRVAAKKQVQRGATPVTFIEYLAPTVHGLEAAIALENHSIPIHFTPEALSFTADLAPFNSANLGVREDLRKIPIVTIDGADARDFDDAVWAEKWENGNERGYHIIVAIADVSEYVPTASPLDNDAFARGNSTYLPTQVVPMLPEKLSNNLCSLVPNEDRPVLAVHLYIDAHGRLKKHHFVRAVIHSHARLTYEQAEAALNGEADHGVADDILEKTLKPLQAAAHTLLEERKNRHALALDLPETQLQVAKTGEITGITTRARLFTHQMIEECMILANVAAATALETKGVPAVYRTHPEPSKEKLESLREMLKQHNLTFSKTNVPTQKDFSQLTTKLEGHPQKEVVMRTLLQTQQQAKYAKDNIGHYGLALQRYSHFTSPIRRYADLIVHRQLIATLGLGDGGHSEDAKRLKGKCDHINITERRSQQAEWETRDRLMARYYHNHVGEKFTAQIITVLKYGMFVRIDGVAEGLLPFRLMKDDHYLFDARKNTVRGKRSGRTLQAGLQIEVTLIGSDVVDGKLTFGVN